VNRRTVVRLRGGSGHDEDGDPNTGAADRTDISGCLVAPRYSDEPAGRGRHGVVIGLTLLAPAGADLVHTDRIEIDGVTYTIEGEPGAWTGTRVGGVEAALKRAAG